MRGAADSRGSTLVYALAAIVAFAGPLALAAQNPDSMARAAECRRCAEFNAPHAPGKIYGNTYWVGTAAVGSILITWDRGHILIDGGVPESAPRILANIRALGFRPEDVKLILNSHTHYDHAGGIEPLRRATGAEVAASDAAARDDDAFLFTQPTRYPTVVSDFEHGFSVLESIPCDILITPHPAASEMWERIARRDAGDPAALVNRDACKQLAANGRRDLNARLARERSGSGKGQSGLPDGRRGRSN